MLLENVSIDTDPEYDNQDDAMEFDETNPNPVQPEENYNEEWAAYKANWINLNKEFLNQDYELWVDSHI